MSPWKHRRRRKCTSTSFLFPRVPGDATRIRPKKLDLFFPGRLAGSLEGSRVKSCNAGFDVCYVPIFPIFALIA